MRATTRKAPGLESPHPLGRTNPFNKREEAKLDASLKRYEERQYASMSEVWGVPPDEAKRRYVEAVGEDQFARTIAESRILLDPRHNRIFNSLFSGEGSDSNLRLTDTALKVWADGPYAQLGIPHKLTGVIEPLFRSDPEPQSNLLRIRFASRLKELGLVAGLEDFSPINQSDYPGLAVVFPFQVPKTMESVAVLNRFARAFGLSAHEIGFRDRHANAPLVTLLDLRDRVSP